MSHNVESVKTPVEELLAQRGYGDANSIREFLSPSLASLPHFSQMRGIDRAVQTILKGIEDCLPLLIWGDYDVDGTTGCALLVNFFRGLGLKNELSYHIPNRLTEGYGLSLGFFEEYCHAHPEFLLVTVDCGISNGPEIAELERQGARVVVTDHHEFPAKPPRCAVIDPAHPECGFNGVKLAGVGVAFYLVAALRAAFSADKNKWKNLQLPNSLKPFLGFVALGTIADVVPLTAENRVIVKAGFEALREPDFPFTGLKILLQSCELGTTDIFSSDIGFNLAPKVNAAGRYGMGYKVVDLLTDQKGTHAPKIALELTKLNAKRKQECKDAMTDILDFFDHEKAKDDGCIIVYGPYFEGIIGILASRLVDQFGLPTLVLSDTDDGMIKGSARSIEGINIVECISNCSFLLKKFGGHQMAAGFSFDPRNHEAFVEAFIAQIKSVKVEKAPKKEFDLEASMEAIFNPKILKQYEQLEPFGPGNPEPTFLDARCAVIAIRYVGSASEHVQLTIRSQYGENIKAIGFFLAEKARDIQAGDAISCIYTPSVNRFNDKISWQAQLKDIVRVYKAHEMAHN